MQVSNTYTDLSLLFDSNGPSPRLQEGDVAGRTLKLADLGGFAASGVKTYRLPGDDHSMVFQTKDADGSKRTYRYNNPQVSLASNHPLLGDRKTRLSFKIENGMLQYRVSPQLKDISFRSGSCVQEA